MSAAPLSFFTVDRGTASTAVALIAPVAGRFRLLAAGVAPRSTDLEGLLEDLCGRVQATDRSILPDGAGWRDWVRLEAGTGHPPRIACVSVGDRVGRDLERTVTGVGWEIAG